MSSNRASISAFISGLLFAIGLGLSGMTDPAKVLGFLDVAGDWDYRLAFVMGGAIAVHAVSRRFILKREKPWFGATFPERPMGQVDARLLAGAALFGVGWGLGGYCPGPALTSLTTGAIQVFVFVPAMLVGMSLVPLLKRPRETKGVVR